MIANPDGDTDSFLTSETGSVQYGGVDDESPLLAVESRKENECTRAFRFVSTLTIEPFLFSYLFAMHLNASCLTNMMMDKGCRYHLNYSEEVCGNLSSHTEEKEIVEILANNYSLYCHLMGLLPAVTMILIAPWSDKYGRKLPLFLASFGTLLSDIGIVMCTVYFESELFYLVLSKIPMNVFGGIVCVITIVFSHASDVSSEKNRLMKFATVEVFFHLGASLGGLAGGMLYRYYGYFYVYLISTAIHTFCILWIVLCVQETTGLDSNASWREKISDFFACESFTKGWKATMRPRENSGKLLLLLFSVSMCFVILEHQSYLHVGYVYVHHIYNWDPASYNTVITVFTISQMVVLLITVPILLRTLKVSDYAVGIVGVISMMAKNFIISFAKYSRSIYYLGNVCGIFAGFAALTIRSGISKIADKDELGRVFSFLATCESIFPMVGSVVVTKVFNATMDFTPNVSYLMIVGSMLIPLGTFVFAYVEQRSRQRRGHILHLPDKWEE